MSNSQDLNYKTPDWNFSSFLRRVLANLLDGLIMFGPAFIASIIIPFWGSLILFFLYKPVFESSPLKATPGKALLGMIVISDEGSRLTFKQAFVRSCVSLISAMALGIGYLLVFTNPKRQALEDLAIDSVVIDQKTPEVNYFRIWLDYLKSLINSKLEQPIFGSSESPDLKSEREVHKVSTEDLEKLHKLYTQGAITEEEFQTKKAEWLKRM